MVNPAWPSLRWSRLELEFWTARRGAAGGRPSLRSMQHHESIPQQKSLLIILKWIRIINQVYLASWEGRGAFFVNFSPVIIILVFVAWFLKKRVLLGARKRRLNVRITSNGFSPTVYVQGLLFNLPWAFCFRIRYLCMSALNEIDRVSRIQISTHSSRSFSHPVVFSEARSCRFASSTYHTVTQQEILGALSLRMKHIKLFYIRWS